MIFNLNSLESCFNFSGEEKSHHCKTRLLNYDANIDVFYIIIERAARDIIIKNSNLECINLENNLLYKELRHKNFNTIRKRVIEIIYEH